MTKKIKSEKSEKSVKSTNNVEKALETTIIGKKDAKLLRYNGKSATKTTITVGFSSPAIADASVDVFKKAGATALDGRVERNNLVEIRYTAPEEVFIRTALRIFKSSGIAVYRGTAPVYVAKASKDGLRPVKALAKKVNGIKKAVDALKTEAKK